MNSEKWYQAEVPGSVQRDLVRHGILPDPFYGTNEELVQWVEDENWDFKRALLLRKSSCSMMTPCLNLRDLIRMQMFSEWITHS